MTLPNFEYDTDAASLFSRFSSTPLDGRAYTLDRTIKRFKNLGLWDKIDVAWPIRNDNEADSLLQLKSSLYNASKVSSMSFTPHQGWSTDSNTKYINTNWNPSTFGIDKDNFHMAFFCNSPVANAASEFGVVNGNLQGISLNPRSANNQVNFRVNSDLITLSNTSLSDGTGFFIVSCSGGNYQVYRDGEQIGSGVVTTINPVSGNVFIGKVNGGTNVSGRSLGWLSFGKSLTSQQALDYYAITHSYLDAERGGHPDFHEPACQPEEVTSDLVIYGANLQGCIAAREAVRQGLSVSVVGGWRERCVGGMTTNGISVLDLETTNSIGGLFRLLLTRINALQGASDSPPATTFQPRVAELALKGFLDPSRSDGANIPIYWSSGIDSVSKSGTVINSLTTVDGRTFYGNQFIDVSYEGDLLAKAGCSYVVGREAAGSGIESLSGERNLVTTDGGNQSQYYIGGGGTIYNINPYVVSGDPNSGLIFGVNQPSNVMTGTSDNKIQAYNFRLTMSSILSRRLAQNSTRPENFVLSNYEAFFRFLKKLSDSGKSFGVDYDLNDIFYFYSVENSNFADINQNTGFGPNFYGQNWTYPEANYEDRELIWKAHETHLRGLLYVMSYGRTNEGELRIPAAMETSIRGWGLSRKHYLDPFNSDSYFWPRQLYIRQARRLIGDFIYNANDLGMSDGTTPRSTKTIACASYKIDSHHVESVVDTNGGNPRSWNTGMVVKDINGSNNMSPLPMEIVLPKRSECTNLTVPFCVSATHLAFNSIRMEPATSALSQACAIIHKLAINNSCDVQDIDYSVLRSQLLASNTLTGEIDPVIPQTN